MEHTNGVTKPYFERDYLQAQYLGKNGEADIDVITGVLDNTNGRTLRLAEDEVIKSGPTAKFDPSKPVDPLDYASKPTNPALKTVELPLISDVWNGSEPINYVCSALQYVGSADSNSTAKYRSAIHLKRSTLI